MLLAAGAAEAAPALRATGLGLCACGSARKLWSTKCKLTLPSEEAKNTTGGAFNLLSSDAEPFLSTSPLKDVSKPRPRKWVISSCDAACGQLSCLPSGGARATQPASSAVPLMASGWLLSKATSELPVAPMISKDHSGIQMVCIIKRSGCSSKYTMLLASALTFTTLAPGATVATTCSVIADSSESNTKKPAISTACVSHVAPLPPAPLPRRACKPRQKASGTMALSSSSGSKPSISTGEPSRPTRSNLQMVAAVSSSATATW
mmetsp:Transcript_5260/g.19783  ORF Transcript_5260/g.19783 Transcript_5260/m.19783 type:complete len:263 (+) Transcript_5260:6022-6810(+)